MISKQIPNNLIVCLLCLVLLPFVQPVTLAQTLTNSCGFDLLHQQRLQTDSLYRMEVERVRQRSMDKANIDMTTVYTIPVVFVVYHLGEPVGTGSNVSEQALNNALTEINRNFRGINNPFPDYPGADTKMQFALAQRTPDCQASNGIVRINAGASVYGYYSQGLTVDDLVTENELRKQTPLYSLVGANSNQFITIHIVHRLNGAAAFARFGDHIFCDYRQLTSLTHELGHVFYLYHTFQGSETSEANNFICPTNEDPFTDGDQIPDTDPHKLDARCQGRGYDTHINECTGEAFGTVLYNYMSYS